MWGDGLETLTGFWLATYLLMIHYPFGNQSLKHRLLQRLASNSSFHPIPQRFYNNFFLTTNSFDKYQMTSLE